MEGTYAQPHLQRSLNGLTHTSFPYMFFIPRFGEVQTSMHLARGNSKFTLNEDVNEPFLSSDEMREDSVERKETAPQTATTPEE